MADDLGLDKIKARIFELSFKKSTQGLSAAEEQELSNLQRQLAMKNAGLK